jgi:hypothetical protein
MAFGEWAATMWIASENGIRALQIGQSLKSDRGVSWFTLVDSIGPSHQGGKRFGSIVRGAHWDRSARSSALPKEADNRVMDRPKHLRKIELNHRMDYPWKAEGDCPVPKTLALCIPTSEGPRLKRVLEAKAKLTPQEIEEERDSWFAAMLTALLQDREDYLRTRAAR